MNRRDKLGLDAIPELKEIPDSYLDMAFQKNNDPVHLANQDKYEFIGDAVYHMIITDMLMEYLLDAKTNPGTMTRTRTRLEKNASFACIMNDFGFCDSKMAMKSCADQFEALLGVFYIYLRQSQNMFRSLDIIHNWLEKTISIGYLLDQAYQGKQTCQIKNYIQTNPMKPKPKVTPALPEWEECDKFGLQKNRITGEVRECQETSICDVDGFRERKDVFTGFVTKEECPETLYNPKTYEDVSCYDGERIIWKQCLDPTKCVDKILSSRPCREGYMIMPPDQFDKLSLQDKRKTIMLDDYRILEYYGIVDFERYDLDLYLDADLDDIHLYHVELLQYTEPYAK